MRVLLVEDDQTLRHGLEEALTKAGYQLATAADGLHADTFLKTEHFDLVVLDLGLPRLDGLSVLQRLRDRQQTTPVLVLSARDRTEDRVRGLDTGADDYLTKPFELSEFEARVRALLRRGQAPTLHLGNLEWSMVNHTGRIGELVLTLSPLEATVLESLLSAAGTIVRKEALAQQIGDQEQQAAANMVEVYIHRLRRKLAAAAVEIHTVRGLGYMLRSD